MLSGRLAASGLRRSGGCRDHQCSRKWIGPQANAHGHCFHPDLTLAPFGGYKQSSIGREFGREAITHFIRAQGHQLLGTPEPVLKSIGIGTPKVPRPQRAQTGEPTL